MVTMKEINPFNIYTWLVLGFGIGIVVHAIDPGNVKGGLFGSILAGIIGALLGGLVTTYIIGTTTNIFSIQSIAISIGAAILFVIFERILFRNTGRIKTETTKLKE